MPAFRNVSYEIAPRKAECFPLLGRLLVSLQVSICRRCARAARELHRIGVAARDVADFRVEDALAIARLEQLAVANIGGATDGGDDGYVGAS